MKTSHKKPLRKFKINGEPIDSTGKPQQGTVVIAPNHDPPLFKVRKKGGRREYILPLPTVAKLVSQGTIIAEAAENRPVRKFRAKRGLV